MKLFILNLDQFNLANLLHDKVAGTVGISAIQSADEISYDNDFLLIADLNEIKSHLEKLQTVDSLKGIMIYHEQEYFSSLQLMEKYSKINSVLGFQEFFPEFRLKQVLQFINTSMRRSWPSIWNLKEDGYNIDYSLLTDSKTRYIEISEITKLIEKYKVRASTLNECFGAIDELTMNGLFDAHPVYSETDRSLGVKVDREEGIILKWSVSDTCLLVSTIDPHGRFKREILLKYLLKNYDPQRGARISYDTMGAGLGLFTLSKTTTSLSVFVVPGMLTEVTIASHFTLRPKQQRKISHSVEYYTLGEESMEQFKADMKKLYPDCPVKYK